MREFFDLANNPLFVKHVRTRLRRSSLLPAALIVAFLGLCITFLDIYIEDFDKGPKESNRNVGLHLLFWLQGLLLVLMGGSQVASSIAQMKESGMIDFHRITPIPPGVQTIGIMLGAPIRELILYALTLPFALFLAMHGSIRAGNFAKLLLVHLGSALMYYSLAMITGLTGGKARGASGRYVVILMGLNLLALFLTVSGRAVGFYGPALMTSLPVYVEVLIENEEAQAEKQRLAQQRRQQQQQFGGRNQPVQNVPPPPAEPPPPEVKFYAMSVPIVLQSLLFQGAILTFSFIAASRRIHSARLPLFRKPIALLFLATLTALTMGSLWDVPTVFLTLGAVYFLVLCSVVLTNTVTPPLSEVVKGMQRPQGQ